MGSTTAAQPEQCSYCGTSPDHGPERCRTVKEIEYYPNGHVKRIVKR